MASSGQDAWTKHFKGKGNIETVMKKDSSVYDLDSPTKQIGTIKAGTKILYLSSKSFEQKASIEYVVNRKKISGRVPFDNMAKPGVKSSGEASLKPQAFNVRDQQYSFSAYRKIVTDAIESRKDLSAETRLYISAIFDYHSGGPTSKQKITKIFNQVKNSIPINSINKDFGEVLGPVAILEHNIFNKIKINLSKGSSKIYVPLRPNEPLMDYAIIVGDKKYTISAKSGDSTNTVKPDSILRLINENSKILKKWQKTDQYKLLSILNSESGKEGPVKAVSALYPNIISPAAAASFTSNDYDRKLFSKFINNNQYLKTKKDPTVLEISYECEKVIYEKTRSGELDMNDIFADAIENKVYYVKFAIDSAGIGEFDLIVADDIKKIKSGRRAFLRSKNGYTRSGDKMGIQI